MEPFGNEEGAADLIICFSDATVIAGEEGAIATQLNRRLAFGGMLVWSITRRTEAGATSDLEQRQRGLRLLQSYGFRVDVTNAWSEPLIDDDRDPAAAEIVEQRAWRAYKMQRIVRRSAVLARYAERRATCRFVVAAGLGSLLVTSLCSDVRPARRWHHCVGDLQIHPANSAHGLGRHRRNLRRILFGAHVA